MTCGPLIQSSPSSPGGKSAPVSGQTIRQRVLGTASPEAPERGVLSGVIWDTGASSVMP